MSQTDPTSKGRISGQVVRQFAILALSASIAGTACASALEDGRIGILYVGCIARSRPFWDMRYDPLFSITFVQATLRDWAAWGPIQQATAEPQVYRMVRLYMPRSYSQMISRFDLIVLSNANREAVGPGNIEMLARGVREGGMALLMSGGWESFGGAFARPDWGTTSIGQLLPTIDGGNIWVEYPRGGLYLIIDKNNHEFIRSIPWEREKAPFMSNFHHNLVRSKEGAEVLAHVRGPGFDDHPAMVTWELEGKNRVFALTGEIHTMAYGPWPYYLDFGANLMIYLERRPVPQDIDMVHSLRTKMYAVAIRRSLLMSLLEFCDSFGANTGKIILRIDELDNMVARAKPLYLDLRFEETLDAYRKVEEGLEIVEQDAIRLKDTTLLWVYLIEWLAVTGTSIICGFVLWSFMVRRRLYREVGTTILRSREMARMGSS